MRRRIVVLLVMVVMALGMLAASAPVFAQGEGFDQGVGGSDTQPGQTEKSRSPQSNPPQSEPGATRRDAEGTIHDTSSRDTGWGNRVEAQGG
jgi:hypothetical protein